MMRSSLSAPATGMALALAAFCAAASPAIAETRLAVAGPASGRHAALLTAMIRAATRTAATLDVSGFADGTAPVTITEFDDGCDPARAKGAAALIVAARPNAVIGHPCPAAAIAAAPVYAAAGIPFIALGVRHPALTSPRAGPGIFRLAGRDDRQGAAAAPALLEAAPGKRIAIIQDRTAYARGLLDETKTALAAAGIADVLIVPIVAGRRDYDAEIAKLTAQRSEAVLFAGYPAEAIVVLRGLRKAGLQGVLIASDANATPEFADAVAALPEADRQVKVMMRAGIGASTAPAVLADQLDPLAAAAVEAWAAAARQAASPAPEKVTAALATGVLKTTGLGELSFDPAGDARVPSYTASGWKAGRWAGDEAMKR